MVILKAENIYNTSGKFKSHRGSNQRNIRMDPAEVGWSDVDWSGLAQDRDRWRALVNSVLNPRLP
jgi:hypothetical protein